MVNSLTTLDLNGLHTGNSPGGTTGNAEGGPSQGRKRKKYAARACHDLSDQGGSMSLFAACTCGRARCSRAAQTVTSILPFPSLYCTPFACGLMLSRYSTTSGANTNSRNPIVPQAPDTRSADAQAPVPSALSDPRVDELCDRVSTIEGMLTRLVKSAKGTGDSSPSATFSTPVERSVAVPGEDDDDADQFALPTTAHDDLTLSSQVAAMSAFLSRPPSPKPGSGRQTATFQVLVELPDTSSLQHLLDVYFREMNSYFPFLDREDTELRIYGVVGRLGYRPCNRTLAVTKEDLSVIALTYISLCSKPL
ncbi:hypothetical protein FGLOB1_8990 [Fusarium globosum]|uniref:Uncharacterized protein n=1 Tax=Fusarium globosum TaxID=78864 RepID=A0A8H5Y237_9HYPO|nr:hypothetical protein FGLOB1_8990 [Fusarium globosum]